MELYSVIKRAEDSGDLLCWKFPGEDFRTHSQLIVGGDDIALFYKDGEVVAKYTEGKFDLATNNLPFIDTFRKWFSGGVSSFNCKVWFINKNDTTFSWGTPAPMQVSDPAYGDLKLKVRMNGSYTICVSEPTTFLYQIVKTCQSVKTQRDVKLALTPLIMPDIQDALGAYISDSKEEIDAIQSHHRDLGDKITPEIRMRLVRYGIHLVSFQFESFDILDTEEYKLVKMKRAEALGDALSSQMIGKNANLGVWQKMQSIEIAKKMAENPNGGMAAAGAGIGMGLGLGNMMAQSISGAIVAPGITTPSATNSSSNGVKCPGCGCDLTSDSQFCHSCGVQLSRRCIKCGANIPLNAKFCPMCGNSMEAKCEQCGVTLEPMAKFCPGCGKKI